VISTPMNAPCVTILWPAFNDLSSDSIVAAGIAKPMFWALVPSWERSRHGGVHANHVAIGVEQWTTGVTWVDGGVGLNHVVQRLGGRLR